MDQTPLLREKINILNNELSSLRQQLFQVEVAAADAEGQMPEDKDVAARIKSEASNARATVKYFAHKIATRERLLAPLETELAKIESAASELRA